MKKVDDLTESARDLKERGLKSGEIADELNVSRETANWLLTHSDESDAPPGDIHLDWSQVGNDARRLSLVSAAMSDLIAEDVDDEPDVIVGIAKAGMPIATLVAQEFGARLAEYTPRKQKWSDEEDDFDELSGSFSRNFADVEGQLCVLVDDVVTSGRTMTEAVRFVDEKGGTPASACVLANKSGKEAIDGVQVNSLLGVTRVE